MSFLVIESKANPLLKELKKLREKKGRSDRGQFLVEGLRFVSEAVKAGSALEMLLFTEEFYAKSSDFIDAVPDSVRKIGIRDRALLAPLCATETPQGIVGVGRIANGALRPDGNLVIVADAVQDPGNMGTIIRTAHAAGAAGVISAGGTVDVYNDKVLRATMGSIFHVPVLDDPNGVLVEQLRSDGWRLAVSSLVGERDFYAEDLTGKVMIAVGNEANGVCPRIESLSDIRVRIPMPGGAESLNVSVAAAVMIFEKLRQDARCSLPR